MPSVEDIIHSCEDEDTAVDDDTPIHGTRHYGRRQREEREYKNRSEETQCDGVDGGAVAAE